MAPAENLGEGWQQQLQQLQSEASRASASSLSVSKGVPTLPRKFAPRGATAQGETLPAPGRCGPSFECRKLRPGVNEASLLRSTECIQRTWRDLVQHRRLMLAKKQLAAGYTVPQVHAPPTQDPMEQRPPEESWSVSLPQEELWDETIFYRHPSVDQVLQAQERWCQQYQKEAEIASLCAMPSTEILQQMRSLEGRLQLRMRGPSSAWRPPCAVGPCARGMLEAMLETAQGPEGGIPHWLVPVAALFQLCLASSYMHWMEPPRSYQHLDQLEASLHGAPSGSYAEAVSPALHARSTLLRAFLALRERRHAAAEVAARDALQILQARQSPRDFWPPHCWELAACHRICAVSLCASGRPARALGELQVLAPLLAPDPTTGHVTSDPGTPLARLKEETSTLQLEVEVVLDVDQHSASKCGVASSTLQAYLRRAQAQLQTASVCTRGRLELLSAKLVLLEELPWFVAGGARKEALHRAHAWLLSARGAAEGWSEERGHALEMLPAESVCAAFMEDDEGAIDLAERWAKSSPEAVQLVSVLKNPRHPAGKVPGATQVIAQSLAKVARPC